MVNRETEMEGSYNVAKQSRYAFAVLISLINILLAIIAPTARQTRNPGGQPATLGSCVAAAGALLTVSLLLALYNTTRRRNMNLVIAILNVGVDAYVLWYLHGMPAGLPGK